MPPRAKTPVAEAPASTRSTRPRAASTAGKQNSNTPAKSAAPASKGKAAAAAPASKGRARAASVSTKRKRGDDDGVSDGENLPPAKAKAPARGKATAATTNGTVKATASRAKRARTAPLEDEEEKAARVPARAQRARSKTPGGMSARALDNLNKKLSRTYLNPLPTPKCALTRSLLKFDVPLSIDGKKSLFMFGAGDMAQLGMGMDDLDEKERPVLHQWVEKHMGVAEDGRVVGRQGVEDIALGGMHSLMVDSDGKLWSWGVSDNAALGRSTEARGGLTTEEFESEPHVVQKLLDEEFRTVRVAAGDSVSVAISDKGQLRAWGSFRANDGLLGFDARPNAPVKQLDPYAPPLLRNQLISSIACGADHVLALTVTGSVIVWGNGQVGQLGRKIIERRIINGLTPTTLHLRHIVLIGSGSYHSFAVDQKGTVYGWGLNSYRQTGADDDAQDLPSPTEITAMAPSQHGGARVVEIAGGEHHTVFLLDNGEVWTVGRYDGHEVGLPADHPLLVQAKEERAKARAAQKEFFDAEFARLKAEAATSEEPFDEPNASAELMGEVEKSFPVPNECTTEPAKITFPKAEDGQEVKIVQIAVSSRHNLALGNNGKAYAWGLGMQSELGLGGKEEQETPREVKSQQLAGFKVVHAATGGQHSALVAVKSEESA